MFWGLSNSLTAVGGSRYNWPGCQRSSNEATASATHGGVGRKHQWRKPPPLSRRAWQHGAGGATRPGHCWRPPTPTAERGSGTASSTSRTLMVVAGLVQTPAPAAAYARAEARPRVGSQAHAAALVILQMLRAQLCSRQRRWLRYSLLSSPLHGRRALLVVVRVCKSCHA